MKNAVFWDVLSCRFCVNRRFGGTYSIHLQGRKIREPGTSVSMELGNWYFWRISIATDTSVYCFFKTNWIWLIREEILRRNSADQMPLRIENDHVIAAFSNYLREQKQMICKVLYMVIKYIWWEFYYYWRKFSYNVIQKNVRAPGGLTSYLGGLRFISCSGDWSSCFLVLIFLSLYRQISA
jgi:hypothetical protein